MDSLWNILHGQNHNTKASEEQTAQLFLQPASQTHLQLLCHKVSDSEKPVNYRKGIRKVKLNFIFSFMKLELMQG